MSSSILVLPEALDLGATWVHLQDFRTKPTQFKIVVPAAHVIEVFGANEASGSSPTSMYVKHRIDEFGTFIVDGYFQSIRKLLRSKNKTYQWVIAAIDDVQEENGDITLVGSMVDFNGSLYK